MAQTLSRTSFPQGTRTPRNKTVPSQIFGSKAKKMAQAFGTLAVLGTVLRLAIESNMYIAELAAASIIISLITFIRLVGDNN